MIRWRAAVAAVRAWVDPAAPPSVDDVWTDEALIDSLRVTLDVRCPCGSATLHHLGYLHATADCRRCRRTLQVRALHYAPVAPDDPPSVTVALGFVETPAARRARGA